MAIDAVIEGVRYKTDKTELTLKPRMMRDGQLSNPGRRRLYITINPHYTPKVGDEIWGNTHQVMIGEHEFRRIMRLWDGTYEVL
jgi:hypothetical protein